MPLFFIIFLVLAVRVAFLPGAVEGYKYMFTPRWADLLDPMVWIWAMGQREKESNQGCGSTLISDPPTEAAKALST